MAMLLKKFWASILAQHDRWILWTPVPLALGIYAYFSLKSEPSYLIGLVGLSVIAVLAGAFYKDKRFLPLWIAIFLIALGFAAAQWRTHQVAAPVLQKKTYAIVLSGRIAEVDPLPQNNRIVLDQIELVSGKLGQDVMPERVRIRLKKNDPAVPEAGDRIRIKAMLLPLSGPVLPGAFDFQRYAFFERLGATGFAVGDMEVLEKSEQGFFFQNLRRIIRNHVEANVENPGHAGLLTAFMIGESHGIPEDIWELSRLSGIAHLIAISGSHFVLIAGFPFFIIRALLAAIPFIALRFPIKKIAAVFAIAAAVFYMFLIGSPIPAQRAVISVTVVMLAIILDRDPFTLRLAAFSALVILLFEPESLMGASFQLSFAAIVALIAFYDATRTYWQEKFREPHILRRWSFYLIGTFLTTLVASFATAPFSLYNFGRMPLLAGWVANLIAVPLSSFITFPICLIACLLMPFGLEYWPLKIAEKTLDIIMTVASEVITWPHASLVMDAWPASLLAMIVFGGLWLCLWSGRVRYLGIVPILVAIILIPLTPRPDLLISDSGRLIALRQKNEKLWINSARVEKFARNEWIKREGSEGSVFWPTRKDNVPVSWIQCEGKRCDVEWRQKQIVTIDNQIPPDGLCPDILITSYATEHICPETSLVFDKKYLRLSGAVAAYLEPGGGLDIRSAQAERGTRPWVIKPRPWLSREEYLKQKEALNSEE